MQGDLETGIRMGVVNSGTSCSDLSLQITPRPIGLGSSLSGKGLLQSQDAMNGGTSSKGFLQTLSLMKKFMECDGERSPLPNSEPAPNLPPPVSRSVSGMLDFLHEFVELYVMSRWQKPSPVVMATELLCRLLVENSLFCDKKHLLLNYERVSSSSGFKVSFCSWAKLCYCEIISFATHEDNGQTDTSDALLLWKSDEVTPVLLEENDEEIPEEEAICEICHGACDEGNTPKTECSCKGALRVICEEYATQSVQAPESRFLSNDHSEIIRTL
ncbi:uncharacterized protein LOC127811231 [Diospyros lotus]|uniref:uncharacterized protein LOC127811231 n=1 Tax=Diospyros lotus TaxID=55363 RepID=UPI0022508850|nr:uncharacterized protein LOC127811231 [Diospyros lotus]